MQKNGAFFYMIGSLSNGKFVEKKRFYVNNSAGYEQPQDIFYHSKYGLFVVTNKKTDGAFTIYNMLLCAKIPDELSSVTVYSAAILPIEETGILIIVFL